MRIIRTFLATVLVSFVLSFTITPSFASAAGTPLGRVVLNCSSCTTVSGFISTAKLDSRNRLPSLDASGVFTYVVVNGNAKLLARASVHSMYDYETRTRRIYALTSTGTIADLRQAYRETVPDDLAPADIPTGIATTFTGYVQANAVSNYLEQQYANNVVPARSIVFVEFSDGSMAEYQLTNYSNQQFSFVSGSGHDANGNPLNNYGNPPSPGKNLGARLTSPIYVNSDEFGRVGIGGSSDQRAFDAFVAMFVRQGKTQPFKFPDGHVEP